MKKYFTEFHRGITEFHREISPCLSVPFLSAELERRQTQRFFV